MKEIVPFKQLILDALNPGGEKMDVDAIIADYSAAADGFVPDGRLIQRPICWTRWTENGCCLRGLREVCWMSITARFRM